MLKERLPPMIVFDIVVGGEVKETIKPKTAKLKEICQYVAEQVQIMKLRYGHNIKIERRILY